MNNPDKQFPWIRVFGTVGWICAGVLITILDISITSSTFIMAAGASLLLGIYSFLLPNTPPSANKDVSAARAIGTEAFVLFKNKPYLIFFIAAILVCIPLSFYYGWANPFLKNAGMTEVEARMTIGQVSEALFILAIPFLFRRIGVKNMLLLGMTAWILRYLCFAYGNINSTAWMLYAGIILHGICYDFFFVTGYMYTEMKAGPKIKNAAQGLFTFATYGLGMLIGQYFSGFIADSYTSAKGFDWEKIWLVPTYIAVGVLLYFIFFFNEKKQIQSIN